MKQSIEKITFQISLILAIVVSVADLFGLIDRLTWLTDRIPTIILLLFASLALYWITVHKRDQEKLETIEKLASLNSINAKMIATTEEAMTYLSQRFLAAKHSIEQAAVAPSLKPVSYKNYDEALTRVL